MKTMTSPGNTHFTNDELLIYEILQKLLHSIKEGDTDTYKRLSSESLTCIEPETGGNIVHGLPFHLFLVERTSSSNQYHIEIVNPVINVYGDTAYAAYILTNSYWNGDHPSFIQVQETRIFHKEAGEWKMVHFHRSEI